MQTWYTILKNHHVRHRELLDEARQERMVIAWLKQRRSRDDASDTPGDRLVDSGEPGLVPRLA
jgi:hypothetical protein